MAENLDFFVLSGEYAGIAKHLYGAQRHSAELPEVP